jgi:hypothetical protein
LLKWPRSKKYSPPGSTCVVSRTPLTKVSAIFRRPRVPSGVSSVASAGCVVDLVTSNEPKARTIGSYFSERRPAPTAASAAILGWISRYWSRTGSGPARKFAVAST